MQMPPWCSWCKEASDTSQRAVFQHLRDSAHSLPAVQFLTLLTNSLTDSWSLTSYPVLAWTPIKRRKKKKIKQKANNSKRTDVNEVNVVPTVCILQLVGHHPQSHDLPANHHVRLGNIDFHLWVIHLTCQAVSSHRKVISKKKPFLTLLELQLSRDHTEGWERGNSVMPTPLLCSGDFLSLMLSSHMLAHMEHFSGFLAWEINQCSYVSCALYMPAFYLGEGEVDFLLSLKKEGRCRVYNNNGLTAA